MMRILWMNCFETFALWPSHVCGCKNSFGTEMSRTTAPCVPAHCRVSKWHITMYWGRFLRWIYMPLFICAHRSPNCGRLSATQSISRPKRPKSKRNGDFDEDTSICSKFRGEKRRRISLHKLITLMALMISYVLISAVIGPTCSSICIAKSGGQP